MHLRPHIHSFPLLIPSSTHLPVPLCPYYPLYPLNPSARVAASKVRACQSNVGRNAPHICKKCATSSAYAPLYRWPSPLPCPAFPPALPSFPHCVAPALPLPPRLFPSTFPSLFPLLSPLPCPFPRAFPCLPPALHRLLSSLHQLSLQIPSLY